MCLRRGSANCSFRCAHTSLFSTSLNCGRRSSRLLGLARLSIFTVCNTLFTLGPTCSGCLNIFALVEILLDALAFKIAPFVHRGWSPAFASLYTPFPPSKRYSPRQSAEADYTGTNHRCYAYYQRSVYWLLAPLARKYNHYIGHK